MPHIVTYRATVPTILQMAQLNLNSVKTPEEHTDIILVNIYKNIAMHPDPLAIAEAFNDTNILFLLDECRYPTTKRLCFDFTRTASYGKSSGDLATFALRYGHLGTALNLLLEEHATWAEYTATIIRGSSRTLADGTTWFHKILTLASKLYENYKGKSEKHAELIECLQHLMQIFSDVLDTHPPKQKNAFILNLRKYFDESSSSACAIAILKAFLPKASVKDDAKFSKITEHYGLTLSVLDERKHLMARSVAAGLDAEENEKIKAYLKNKYYLSALMLNRRLFEECIATFTPLHIEALIETMIKLSREEQIDAIKYSLKSLSPEQAKKFLDHMFNIVNIHYIFNYVSVGGTKEISAPDTFRIAQDMVEITNIAMEYLGNQQQQLNYIYTAIKTRGIDSTAVEHPFLRHMGVYFCTYVPGFSGLDKLEADTTLSLPSEFENFPQLAEKYAGKLAAFRAHLAKALNREEVWRIVEFEYYCTYLWQAYLYHMWIEFNTIDCAVFSNSFHMIDYIFEMILQKPKTYPRLYAQLTDTLLSSNYFSNKKLEYFFKYRFGENGAIATKVRVSEGVRQGLHKRDGTSELIKADFGEEPKSLAKIEAALIAKQASIYAQLAFANEWTTWADSKEEIPADAKSPGFKFMLEHLLKRTPFAAQIKNYARHKDSQELRDNALDYLVALVDDPARFGTFDYEFLLDKFVFTQESAQACLLMFLFLYGDNIKNKHYINLSCFIERLFITISKQFDQDPLKQADFAALYEEMGKHRFFKSLVQDELCRIIYRSYHIPALPTPSVVEDLALEETTAPSKTKRKRHRKKKAYQHTGAANAGAGKDPEEGGDEDEDEVDDAPLIQASAPPCPVVTAAAIAEAPTLEMMQPQLQERLKLPKEMPVIKQLAALFSEKAKLAIFGSALFFSNPLDIDLKLTWLDPAVSLNDAKTIFQALIESAGFKITFTRELIGAISFTLKGKGDGYGLEDYKEIDITLQLADPTSRPTPLHHNTHCAASLDVTSGFIDCELETAKKIVEGVFELYHHPIAAPIEAFKAGVQSLTSLMRAWHENQEGTIVLSAREQALLAKITKHEGNWASLRAEDEALATHLQGMITRHFIHYQPTETYRKRTHLLFNFLHALKVDMKSGIEQATACAIKNMLMDDLLNYEGTPFLVKTEYFLAFCRELNLPMNQVILKESLTIVLQNHFSHYSEGPGYLAKTALLVNFFHRSCFRLLARLPGQEYPCEFLGVCGNIFYFSDPLVVAVPEQAIIFTPSMSLLEANQKALFAQMQAMMASLPPMFAASPSSTASSCATVPMSPIALGTPPPPYSAPGSPTFFSLAPASTAMQTAPIVTFPRG